MSLMAMKLRQSKRNRAERKTADNRPAVFCVSMQNIFIRIIVKIKAVQ